MKDSTAVALFDLSYFLQIEFYWNFNLSPPPGSWLWAAIHLTSGWLSILSLAMPCLPTSAAHMHTWGRGNALSQCLPGPHICGWKSSPVVKYWLSSGLSSKKGESAPWHRTVGKCSCCLHTQHLCQQCAHIPQGPGADMASICSLSHPGCWV